MENQLVAGGISAIISIATSVATNTLFTKSVDEIDKALKSDNPDLQAFGKNEAKLKRLSSERRLKIHEFFPGLVKTSIGEKICTEFVEGLNDLSEEQKSDIRNRSIRLAESDIHLTLNNVSVANDILEEIQKVDDKLLSDMFNELLISNFDSNLKEKNYRVYLNILKDLSPECANVFNEFIGIYSEFALKSINNQYVDFKALLDKEKSVLLAEISLIGDLERKLIDIKDMSLIDNLERLKLIKVEGLYPKLNINPTGVAYGENLSEILEKYKPSDTLLRVSLTELGEKFARIVGILK